MLLCGCGTARAENPPKPESSANSGSSLTTSPASSAAATELSLSAIFRQEGVLLTGTTPSVVETLNFVAFFQYLEGTCEKNTGGSGGCPALGDADVVAQMYLEQHNQAQINAHRLTPG
jgi:hypothetical protein